MSEIGTPCTWMRGGSSKGGYFLAQDLPADTSARDALLLNIMGSPDHNQIDGMGGGDPLRSKVAIVKPSQRSGVDIDYLFLQVFVDQALVSDAQNCGNILAGIGPFAIEQGLVEAKDGLTSVSIFMENTSKIATAQVQTPGRKVQYQGDTAIAGVPGTSAPIPLLFNDIAGSKCGSLLPSGNVVDTINGIDCTLIDNGMPCVIIRADAFGLTGQESPDQLEGNQALKTKLETIRLAAGPMMNLGDVSTQSVPKMTLVSAPSMGGIVMTRSFIPHRCHASIGVLAAVTVATACLLPDSPAASVARLPSIGDTVNLDVEHPSGLTGTALQLNDQGKVVKAGVIRTARKLMQGLVF